MDGWRIGGWLGGWMDGWMDERSCKPLDLGVPMQSLKHKLSKLGLPVVPLCFPQGRPIVIFYLVT